MLCVLVLGHPPAEHASVGGIRVGPYLQNATPESIWIAWETESGDESRVDYGLTTALGSLAFGGSIQSVGAARIHQTRLEGLLPDTRYYYQATTGGASSPVFHFRTPPHASAEKPLRFVAYSDTQGDGANPAKHTEIVNDGIIDFVTAHYGPDLADEVAFVINAGDLVTNGNDYAQWKTQFFDEAQNLTPHEVKTIITRAAEGTKIVLTGDPYQIDNPYIDSTNNGLVHIVNRFRAERIAGHVTLLKGERSELAELASNLL